MKRGVGLHFIENDLDAWLSVAAIVELVKLERLLEKWARFEELHGQ